jgi:perosamine synthetase
VIPLARPDITDEDIEAVARVLRTGQLVQGKYVAEFESAIGRYTDGGEVVAVSSGTAALQLALLALGIGPGDDVGVATYSWPASANAIVLCGARPVFLDIDEGTLGIEPRALTQAISRGARLKAVIPVHAFGNMARIVDLVQVARTHGIPIVEDAACALGASLGGMKAGAHGDIGCYSFHPRKAATTGEGGALRTANAALAQKLRTLRNHGMRPESGPVDFVDAGFNFRMTEFQAALGTSQLARYESLLARRRELAGQYDELLRPLPVRLPQQLEERSHIFQSYVIHLDERSTPRRNAIIQDLRKQGVETNIGTHHMPLLSYYRQRFGHSPGDFPVSDRVAASALALPLFAGMRREDQRFVVHTLGELLA